MLKREIKEIVINLLNEGEHPADVYEDLADQYGNLRKNDIFEFIAKEYVKRTEGKNDN